jgi:hypothetical protein
MTNENPAYALIDVDEETMLPTNFRIFYANLEEANKTGEPEWVQLIDYVKDYGMTEGMSPDALYELATRMTTDQDFFWDWKYDETRDAGDKYIGTAEEYAKKSNFTYCYLTSSHSREFGDCKGHESMPGTPLDAVIGKWKEVSANYNF